MSSFFDLTIFKAHCLLSSRRCRRCRVSVADALEDLRLMEIFGSSGLGSGLSSAVSGVGAGVSSGLGDITSAILPATTT